MLTLIRVAKLDATWRFASLAFRELFCAPGARSWLRIDSEVAGVIADHYSPMANATERLTSVRSWIRIVPRDAVAKTFEELALRHDPAMKHLHASP